VALLLPPEQLRTDLGQECIHVVLICCLQVLQHLVGGLVQERVDCNSDSNSLEAESVVSFERDLASQLLMKLRWRGCLEVYIPPDRAPHKPMSHHHDVK
jgi:hypothetical protein